MDQVINQVVLYLLLAVGGVGVCLALPRKGVNPQPVGALVAAAAGGLLVLILTLNAGQHRPNIYFYIFAAIALGGGLRVITHPRPVYAALYFILTVLASSGLFVLLAAEFLAFALVIVYAGAILITYLFVIMLATQAPTEDRPEALAEYDAVSREPLAATVVGFVLLGVLTTMLFGGLKDLPAGNGGAGQAEHPGARASASSEAIARGLPGRYSEPQVEAALRRDGLMAPDEKITRDFKADPAGVPLIDVAARHVWVSRPDGTTRAIEGADWPADLEPTNVEGVAFELLAAHPGAIEIAGVILLMAMLGAVVLARKQVQLDEEAKARHAAKLPAGGDA